MSLEHKYCQLGTDLIVTDGATIEGYASLFGKADQGGDTVEVGAYDQSLKITAQKGGRIKMLWQHKPSEPIGVWDEVRADKKGLWVRGRILTDVARGKEAAALIEAGAIDGLSIGYRTIKARKSDKGGRLLSELELWEVSLVTFPMLPEARVGAKGDDPDGNALRELAAAFDNARSLMTPV